MSHAIRNTLILLVILIAICAFFYMDINRVKAKIAETEVVLTTSKSELERYQHVSDPPLYIAWLQAQKDYLDDWTIENSKFFLNTDNSRISWEYFLSIRNRFNPDFHFNFIDATRSGDTQYNITGTSRIADIYTFINFIEKLGALYTVESLSLNPNFTETDDGPVNLVSFTMLIKPWVNKDTGRDILSTPFRRISYAPLRKDPFRPGVYEPMIDPVQEKLLKPEDLRLVSFTGNNAFFVDKEKNLISLRPNQPVAYGYYSHIDEQSRAVFKINRTGLYETVYNN